MEKFLVLNFLFLFAVASPSIAVEIDCEFLYINSISNYACAMTNVFKEPIEATSITGNHAENLTDSNVNYFFVRSFGKDFYTMYYPSKMCTQFVNLELFFLWSPSIVELKREIFEGCTKLSSISIGNIKLKKLDDDLFIDVPNIESFEISHSKLEFLQKNIFKNNLALKKVTFAHNNLNIIEVDFPKNLKVLSLLDNICIDAKYDHEDWRSTPYEIIIQKVEESCRNISTIQSQPLESSDEQRIKLLEGKIERLRELHLDVYTQVQLESHNLNEQFDKWNMKVRVLSENIVELQNNVNGELAEKVKNATENFEEIHIKINQIVEESHQMEIKLDTTMKLGVENQELRDKKNSSENWLIGLFILQIMSIVFAVFFTIYVKNYTKI